MKCPKCGSENVSTHVVDNLNLKTQHHGLIYWLLIGWWLQPALWLFFTPFKLLNLFVGSKKQKLTHDIKTMVTCNSCGHSWTAQTTPQ